MEELFIGQAGCFINSFTHESHEIDLLVQNGSVEIMMQKIAAGSRAVLNTGASSNNLEFFYIAAGEVVCEHGDSSEVLKQGDYFYVVNPETAVLIKAEKDAALLFVSTKPVYDIMSVIANELNNIKQKVKLKDLYTHEHNSRLHKYSMRIAEKLKLNSDEMEKLIFAAMFHDVGKINVPDYILNKPSGLSEEEFGYIKKHPTDGKNIIAETYINRIGDIIEQHHERLDGSGYPHGLRGEQILIEAKIIAVADSYDAMTTDRPYRKAMEPLAAMNELERLVGVHYEKNVVDVFKSILIEQGTLAEAI